MSTSEGPRPAEAAEGNARATVSAASAGLRRAGVLLLGALLFWLVTGPGPLGFGWVPMLSGLVYLGVALVGGRRGGYWAPAAVLCCWGMASVLLLEADVDVGSAPAYLTAVGVGALVAAWLERAGFGVSLLGTAVAITAAGLFFLVATETDVDALTRSTTYALLFAAWGAVKLARAVSQR